MPASAHEICERLELSREEVASLSRLKVGEAVLVLPDRMKPAASHVPSGTVDKAGLELSGPADGGMIVLQYGRAYQASAGE